MISDEAILRKIERQPKRIATFKQLVRELGLHSEERHRLQNRLKAMVANGFLVTIDAGRYQIPVPSAAKNHIVGRLSMHRDGFGFVTPDNGSNDALKARLNGDIFIPPPAIHSAMHGDRVLAEVGTIRPDGRAEGRILRTVVRMNRTVVGTFHYGPRQNYVTPIDQKIAQSILIPPGQEYPEAAASPEKKKKSSHRVIGEEAASTVANKISRA